MSLLAPPPKTQAPLVDPAPQFCAGCDHTETRPLLCARGGAYVQCSHCGLIRTTPLPLEQDLEARAEYWSEHHHLKGDKLQRQFNPVLQELAYGKVLRAIAPYRQSGRLLEIGCAAGAFLDAARHAGWQTSGIELSKAAARYAREERDLDVHAGTVHTVDAFGAGEFDAVVMLDVIEHVFQPAKLLTALQALLRPGGALVVMTPNAKGLGARWLRQDWEAYIPDDHLWLFDRGTLESACTKAGYGLGKTWTMDCNPMAMARSILPQRKVAEHTEDTAGHSPKQASASTPIQRRNRLIRAMGSSRLLRTGRAAVNLVLGATGLGDKLYVLAERP